MGSAARGLLARLPHWSGLVVLLFLCALLHIGLGEYLQSWNAEEREQFRKRLAPEFAALESYSSPTQPYQTLLRRLEDRVFSNPAPAKEFGRCARRLKSLFPGRFEFAFFDATDSPVREWCDMPIPVTAGRRFLQDYRAFSEGRLDSLHRHASFIKTFLGPFIPTKEPLHGRLLPAAENNQRAFAYLSHPRPEGTFVSFVTTEQGWELPLLRFRLDSMQRRSRRVCGALIDLQAPGPWAARFRLSEESGKELLTRLSQQPVPWLWEGDDLWFSREILSGHLLLIRVTFTLSPRLAWASHIAALFPLIAACGFLLLLAGGKKGEELLGTSVRWKLIGSFLLASILPLSIMGVTALRFLQEKQRIDEHRLRETLGRHLQSLDQTYADNLFEIETVTGKLFRAYRAGPNEKAARMLETIRSWKKAIAYDSLRVLDIHGGIESDEAHGQEGLGYSPPGFLLTSLGEKILGWIDPQTATDSPFLQNPTELSEQDLLLTHLSKSIYLIRSFENGFSKLMLGVFPVFDQNDRPRFLAQFMWKSPSLQREFLKRRLPSYGRQNGGIEIFGFNRARPEASVPFAFRHRPRISRFLERIKAPGTVFHSRLPFHDGSLFLAGIRGTHLQDFTLVAAANDFAIRADLARFQWGFLFFGIVILIISGFTALHLSAAVLKPVDGLAQGVRAIQRRNFHFRLPPGETDEFIKLTGAFNAMMENLGDLEIARHIQETLFPQAPLPAGQWVVAGSMVSATTVAGDYFDYHLLENKHLLIAIGDVSGSGVSAALGVTMAKTIIHPESAVAPLHHLLENLHHVLQTGFGGKLEMGICLVRLSLENGTCECVTAGHPPPLVFAERETRFLSIKGLPLGKVAKPEIAQDGFRLLPTERLLLTTDRGLESSTSFPNDMLRRLRHAAEQDGEINVQLARLQEVLDLHSSHRLKGADRTVVLLRPLSSDLRSEAKHG